MVENGTGLPLDGQLCVCARARVCVHVCISCSHIHAKKADKICSVADETGQMKLVK